MLRIEAEERARLQAEFDEEEAQSMASPMSTAPLSRSRYSAEVACSCGGNEGKVSLVVIAKNFGVLGVQAFGGAPAQVKLMRSTLWRPEVVGDAAFDSLYALVQCLPGLSTVQLAAALGTLHAGTFQGGAVALACYSATGAVLCGALGTLLATSVSTTGLGHGALPTALLLGVGAGGLALVVKSALQLTTTLARDPLTQVLCVAMAALAVGAPGTIWTLPAALVLSGLTTVVESWWRSGGSGWRGSFGGMFRGSQPGDSAEKASLQTRGDADDSCAPQALGGGAARKIVRSCSGERTGGVDEEHNGGNAQQAGASEATTVVTTQVPVDRRSAYACVAAYAALLLSLLMLRMSGAVPDHSVVSTLFEPCYRSGTLIWGGSTALIPMVLREPMASATGTRLGFLVGVALSHVVPGAGAFNLVAFLGGALEGPAGALVAIVSIYTPGLLLTYAALPFWRAIRSSVRAKAFLRGLCAASAGLAIAGATLLFDQTASSGPRAQQAVALIAFATHHLGWPASALHASPRFQPAITVATGAALGVPICLPALLQSPSSHSGAAGHGLRPSYAAATKMATTGNSASFSNSPDGSHEPTPPTAATTMSPPPPSPTPPDPSPPPPPHPSPPEEE
jgi:chromate transport protein ChrA